MTTSIYDFIAPVSGKCVPIEAVHNDMFSSKRLGEGVAIFPTEDAVCAPFDGVICAVSPSTRAVTILNTEHSLEMMLCASIDEGAKDVAFSIEVMAGQKVKQGEVLFTCDIKAVKKQGYTVDFPCIVTNVNARGVNVVSGDVIRGQSPIMSCEFIG